MNDIDDYSTIRHPRYEWIYNTFINPYIQKTIFKGVHSGCTFQHTVWLITKKQRRSI